MTGELIRKRLSGGGVREHLYYKCGNEHKSTDHPPVRWRGDDLEAYIAGDLDRLRIPDPTKAAWLRNAIDQAFAQSQQIEANQRRTLASRRARRATSSNGC